MGPFNKILVPVDLSARSIETARYAAALGAELGSELVFVHAIEEGWPLDTARRQAHDRIPRLWGETPARLIMREGEPVSVILDAARSENADLILMPTRGMGGVSRLLSRSLTLRVIERADCPVWASTIDDLSQFAGRRIRSVLCGLSLGPHTLDVLRWAVNLCQHLGATLSVIHTSPGLESVPAYPCEGEWRLWLQKMARDDIRTLLECAGANAEVWLEPGRPLPAIPPVAERLGADLLVIGKSPRKRLLSDLRATSYDMIRQAPCPVASV